MGIKLKKCNVYHLLFSINVILSGFLGTIIKMCQSDEFYYMIGYSDFMKYKDILVGIVLLIQVLWLITLIYSFRLIDIERDSRTKKIPTEFVTICFILYTIFLCSFYRLFEFDMDMMESMEFPDDFIWISVGAVIKKSLVTYTISAFTGGGYFWIATAFMIKIKGKLLKEDSLFVKLLIDYNKNQNKAKHLKRIYLNDIIFIISQIIIISYEIGISYTSNVHSLDISWQFKFVMIVIIPLLFETMLILWRCKIEIKGKDILSLSNEIHNIAKGQKEVENKIPRNSYLFETGEEIKHISVHLSNSIQQQLRNEKLKVDLITNLSHDLKTPLTSIIGYIDLLGAKDYLNDEDKHFVRELHKKAEHLHKMINAMFELSKASSGNMTINKSILNLNKLVMQTLADLDDSIVKSGFDIRTMYSDECLDFFGDGTKLYLVCQNLINNALKYSLTGSRIFIKTYREENNVRLCIQNTASYPINFTPEEIAGRFVRGDESRSDGGNGLGLAIAKTYTEVCGGEFHILIDGDQFKVAIMFPKAESA